MKKIVLTGEALEKDLSSSHTHFFYGDLASQSDLEAFARFVMDQTNQSDGLNHNAAS